MGSVMGYKLHFPTIIFYVLVMCGMVPSFFLTKPIELGLILGWGVSIVIDDLSSWFLVVVTLVSMSVFSYSRGYMGVGVWWDKFIVTLWIFVLSMFLLSVSGSLIFSILGWDGLGLSSLALIFFYRGWNGFRSGMVTFYCNRLGDLLLILCVALLSSGDFAQECSFLLAIGALTKTAQFPFHVWLPMAMAAPTPVSSLVHSSTLVTAGLYLLMRFGDNLSPASMEFVLWVSFMTLIYSGWNSMVESDLKKVVAHSTLVHLSMMVGLYSVGDFIPSLVHLACHAFMKSSLFMSSGAFIHLSWGDQDIRFMNTKPLGLVLLVFLSVVSCLSMIGIPFLSGFFSKEFMLCTSEDDLTMNFPVVMILLGVFFSTCYSVRILTGVLGANPFALSLCEWSVEKLMSTPPMALLGGVVVLGSLAVSLDSNQLFSESLALTPGSKLGVICAGLFGLLAGSFLRYSRIGQKPYSPQSPTIGGFFPMFEVSWVWVSVTSRIVDFLSGSKFVLTDLSENSKLSATKLFAIWWLSTVLVVWFASPMR